ncbi:MAG TPA: integrase core domain-containing protein [Acidimicrobiia bacterium]|nr:integrase core domain-containing protein [Acidimicrobiia bacterium]
MAGAAASKTERFGRTVRTHMKGDFLSGRVFDTIEEAQAAVDVWVELHNTERLHQGIRMVPPIAYAWMREGSDSSKELLGHRVVGAAWERTAEPGGRKRGRVLIWAEVHRANPNHPRRGRWLSL